MLKPNDIHRSIVDSLIMIFIFRLVCKNIVKRFIASKIVYDSHYISYAMYQYSLILKSNKSGFR